MGARHGAPCRGRGRAADRRARLDLALGDVGQPLARVKARQRSPARAADARRPRRGRPARRVQPAADRAGRRLSVWCCSSPARIWRTCCWHAPSARQREISLRLALGAGATPHRAPDADRRPGAGRSAARPACCSDSGSAMASRTCSATSWDPGAAARRTSAAARAGFRLRVTFLTGVLVQPRADVAGRTRVRDFGASRTADALDDRSVAAPDAALAGRRAGRTVGRAAHWRRPVRPHALESAHGRSRLPPANAWCSSRSTRRGPATAGRTHGAVRKTRGGHRAACPACRL